MKSSQSDISTFTAVKDLNISSTAVLSPPSLNCFNNRVELCQCQCRCDRWDRLMAQCRMLAAAAVLARANLAVGAGGGSQRW